MRISSSCRASTAASRSAVTGRPWLVVPVINGLAIRNRRAEAMGGYLALHTNPPGGLANYYRENVIGRTGAFVVPIEGFDGFDEAMLKKLINEIAGK